MNKVRHKSFSYRIVFSISVVLAISCSFSCIKKEAADIEIGVIAPMTGNAAAAGEMVKRGIDLALEELNNEGGIKGKKISIIYEDSQGDPKVGVSAIQKLTSQYHVVAIIGDVFSSVTLAAAPIAEKTKTVLLSPAASSPKISEAGDYIFRIWPSDAFEGGMMAKFISEKNKISKVSTIYSSDDYGVGINDVFTKYIKDHGGNLVSSERYNEGDTDFRTLLSKIKKKNPEGIYLIGHYKEMSQILRQAKELGIQKRFFSVSALEVPELIKLAGNAAEGVIYFAPTFNTESEEKIIRDFVSHFQAKFKMKPGIIEAHSYDALKLLAVAMKDNNISGSKIKDSLYNIRNYTGVTGQMTFDSNGDVIKPLTIKTVRDQNFIVYK